MFFEWLESSNVCCVNDFSHFYPDSSVVIDLSNFAWPFTWPFMFACIMSCHEHFVSHVALMWCSFLVFFSVIMSNSFLFSSLNDVLWSRIYMQNLTFWPTLVIPSMTKIGFWLTVQYYFLIFIIYSSTSCLETTLLHHFFMPVLSSKMQFHYPCLSSETTGAKV